MPYYFKKTQRPVRVLDDFLSMVERTDGCWLWLGAVTYQGYGSLWEGRTRHCAHRVSWALHYGPIEDGKFVCHRCDNPKCVRPEHLFLGTPLDNIKDMFSKGRENKAFGVRHGSHTKPESVRMGSQNNLSKLKEGDVLIIKQMIPLHPISAIAKQFGVIPKTVRHIKAGRTWKHVQLFATSTQSTDGP